MEAETHPDDSSEYVLHLYIAGDSPSSAVAVRNLQELCAEHLAGRVDMQVIDIQQHPELAQQDEIVATPTLVKKRPGLTRFLVGDLSDRRRVLALLGLATDSD